VGEGQKVKWINDRDRNTAADSIHKAFSVISLTLFDYWPASNTQTSRTGQGILRNGWILPLSRRKKLARLFAL